MVTNSYIGAMCREFRETMTCCSQTDVAKDMHISREQVSRFERGVRPSTIAFMWYIKSGIFEWIPPVRWNGWIGYHGET